jgi:hypothetical protein
LTTDRMVWIRGGQLVRPFFELCGFFMSLICRIPGRTCDSFVSPPIVTGGPPPRHAGWSRRKEVIMRIFVAGTTGVIGRRLVPMLVAGGHEVVAMTRSPGAQDPVWLGAPGR